MAAIAAKMALYALPTNIVSDSEEGELDDDVTEQRQAVDDNQSPSTTGPKGVHDQPHVIEFDLNGPEEAPKIDVDEEDKLTEPSSAAMAPSTWTSAISQHPSNGQARCSSGQPGQGSNPSLLFMPVRQGYTKTMENKRD